MKPGDLKISCTVCSEAIDNIHNCFDRRIENLTGATHEGKQVTSINIKIRESLLMYCSLQCWQIHEPAIKEAFEFKQRFPAFGFVSPCCRCSKLVNRTKHYVCYSISKMEFDYSDHSVIYSHCLDDDDYALVCQDCEDFDCEPGAEVALERNRERESIE